MDEVPNNPGRGGKRGGYGMFYVIQIDLTVPQLTLILYNLKID